MALSKIQSESMNLADTYAFTGTVSGVGKVLQVVNASFSTAVTTTSTSFTSLGSPAIEATITPTSTSSKILVRFITSTYTNYSGQSTYITLYRGTVASGTHLGQSTEGLCRAYNSAGGMVINLAFEVLDSPSTTNAQTYQIGFKNSSSSNSGYFMFNGTPAELILMEIAG